ncbi:preprotein translocase subunit Tim44 [Dechloromonas denitrificans]|uniref:Preprotein translocase subunit Tim44 n=1 Tax=Dechloromonas denitrificans TaxID=281362 RepID=A0A133XFS0_9RHOO|nr:Tim44-like domain-containing protein [Dechloromonas denitrificans]KXB29749.1 preprotein translocase subunit Tim44 [Dechloromonas denitrificans]
MKSFALMAAALVLGFTLTTGDAEAARRLGGGSSSGMQRQAVTPNKATNAAPTQQQAAAPAAAPQAQPKRSWMGPLAGLAAGLGLAALASHFGFGEGLANMMMIGLLVMAVVMVIGFVMRKKAGATQAGTNHGMQYAGAGANYDNRAPVQPDFTPAGGSAAAAPLAANTGNSGHIPADFDVDGFVRNAKVNFIRLQAANDAGNLDDIREFTAPEMFAEIKLAMGERGTEKQETDVVQLNAEVLDVAEESSRYIVSVRFHGLIREEKAASAEAFDEIWHMTKPRNGSGGWVLAGIQQVQ